MKWQQMTESGYNWLRAPGNIAVGAVKQMSNKKWAVWSREALHGEWKKEHQLYDDKETAMAVCRLLCG